MTTSPAVAVPQLIIRNEPMGLSPGSGASPDEARLSAVDARSSTAAPSGAGSNASSSPPAPSSGNTAPKQETAPAAEEEEVDELRDDDPVVPPPPPPQPRAPAPASAAAPVVPSPKPAVGGGGGSKSRKSSCDLCHHRKIKCDQVRPSCSSCLRKGHPCHYSEESDANSHSRRATTGGVSASGEGRAAAVPRASLGNSNGGSPAWMSSAPARPKPVPNGHSRPHSQTGGPGGNKRRLDRDRIVNGYGSSSDEEDTRSKSATAAAAASGIDNDLADMLGDPKDEEVDELMDSDLEGTSARGKKRDASVDDELSGELLELASAPPKKKKSKPAAAIPEASYMQHRPYSQPRPRPSRASVPAHIPSPPSTVDSYSLPLLTLMQSLPSAETQSILLDTFFHDPFLSEGFSLLRPQFDDDFKKLMERRRSGGLREGDATTLANVFAVLAIALRVLPVETGRLLLASGSSAASNAPRSASRVIANQPSSAADPTPLDQRYFELALLAAQIAEQLDAPSVMYVVHKFLLFRYATFGLRKDKIVLAGSWLGHAIKTAQALGLGKEWEGIPQGERELRRRVFWALFVADRQFSFDTTFPYTINDTHVGVHMPSPLADADLYQMPPDSPVLPPHSIEAGPTSCTALYIHTHLTRRLTPVLDAFIMDNAVTQGDLVSRFEASLDSFQETLPPYLRLFPLTDTRFDSQHSYLPAHRVRLHATLFGYRLGVHRGHLNSYLKPSSGKSPIRAHIAQICLASLRTQKSAKMLDPKLSPRLFDHAMVFEATVTLALIMYIERTLLVASAGSAPAMSSEYLSMRAGLADGLEMLDNSLSVTDNGHYEYARKAVRILREITAKVDAGPRAPYGDSASPSKPNGIRNPNGSVNGARESTSPSRERSPGPSSVIATVSAWVDSWRMAPIGYLLREASVDHWSKLLSGM